MSSPDSDSLELVAELHRRQGEMYAGGSIEAVVELLSDDVIWHVPGASPIAGDHRGPRQVIGYFEKRRKLASGTMRMSPGAAIGEGNAVVQLVGGSAVLGGEEVTWQTVGAYRVENRRIAEAWLVPLDLDLFDRLWAG